MARDLVSIAVSEQLAAQQNGGRFDSEAIRAAVAAEARGDHLTPEDLDRMAAETVAQAQGRLGESPTGPGGSRRVLDSIQAKRHATELRRIAEGRRGSQ